MSEKQKKNRRVKLMFCAIALLSAAFLLAGCGQRPKGDTRPVTLPHGTTRPVVKPQGTTRPVVTPQTKPVQPPKGSTKPLPTKKPR